MRLNKTLVEKRSAIAAAWFAHIVDAYAPETARFLKNKKDPFANPVGGIYKKDLSGLLDVLFGEEDIAQATQHLEGIIKIRAVQNFTPAQAVGFIFDLKELVRREVGNRQAGELADELRALEARIDALGLLSFDYYSSCREKLYQLKLDELRSNRIVMLDPEAK